MRKHFYSSQEILKNSVDNVSYFCHTWECFLVHCCSLALIQCIFTFRLNVYWSFKKKLTLLVMFSRMKNCGSVCPHFACRAEHATGILYFYFFAFYLLLFKMNYRNKITIFSMQRDKIEGNHKCYIWKKSQTEEKLVRVICTLSKQFWSPVSSCITEEKLWKFFRKYLLLPAA